MIVWNNFAAITRGRQTSTRVLTAMKTTISAGLTGSAIRQLSRRTSKSVLRSFRSLSFRLTYKRLGRSMGLCSDGRIFVRFRCVSTCVLPWPKKEKRLTAVRAEANKKKFNQTTVRGVLYTECSNTLVVVAGFISAGFRAWPRSGSCEQGFKESSLAHAQTTIVLKEGGSNSRRILQEGRTCVYFAQPHSFLFSLHTSSHLCPLPRSLSSILFRLCDRHLCSPGLRLPTPAFKTEHLLDFSCSTCTSALPLRALMTLKSACHRFSSILGGIPEGLSEGAMAGV